MTKKTFISENHHAFPIHAALVFVGVTMLTLTGASCTKESDPVIVDLPPSTPDGLFTITGDGEVTICWNPNPESDIAGYDVWWNDGTSNTFEYVGSTGRSETCYLDSDVDNGTTYFYAVSAFDRSGLESDLAYLSDFGFEIRDTPRPEGTDLVLFDYLGQNTSLSGYNFSSLTGTPQAWDVSSTDVYFGAPNGIPTLFAVQGAGVDIQDYGYIELVAVDWAPTSGWAPSGRVELIQGHSYIVRIVDSGGLFNMAKVYVSDVSPTQVTLDWAYQTDPDNPELAPGGGAMQ